jgi:hypothetical protein
MHPGRRFGRTWLKRLLMLTFIYSTLPVVVDANVISRIIHHVEGDQFTTRPVLSQSL